MTENNASEVITLAGWPPEVLAYAYAMYSRSSLSIRDSIKKITDEKAEKFLETFYFKYGHASIADNAHIPSALENISQIAAYALEDEQLWDGQERSTRYQDFGKAGAYFLPSSVKGSLWESSYHRTAEFLLERYRFFSEKVFEGLVSTTPKPDEMKQDEYERTLHARAFDVSRYWLFNGILTNVGQITNARTLERQISRLMSSEYPELQELGRAIKRACSEKPFCPEGKDEPPVAPTLVKYTNPNAYRAILGEKMRSRFSNLQTELPSRYVKLAPSLSLMDEVVATLAFEFSDEAYEEIIRVVSLMSEGQKEEVIDEALADRGQHDYLPKAFESGYQIQYDICMDRGGERDLHRHRNCVQVHQNLTNWLGYDTPQLVHDLGLTDIYKDGMEKIQTAIVILRQYIGRDSDYLIPFAFRSRTLYKMHLAQAGYMSELRSREGGHFSYREVACQMEDQLVRRHPFLRGKFRVTPFTKENLLKR